MIQWAFLQGGVVETVFSRVRFLRKRQGNFGTIGRIFMPITCVEICYPNV